MIFGCCKVFMAWIWDVMTNHWNAFDSPTFHTPQFTRDRGGGSKWGAVSNVRATNGRQIRAICLHREARPNKSDKFANLRGAGVDLYAGCGTEVTPLSHPPIYRRDRGLVHCWTTRNRGNTTDLYILPATKFFFQNDIIKQSLRVVAPPRNLRTTNRLY